MNQANPNGLLTSQTVQVLSETYRKRKVFLFVCILDDTQFWQRIWYLPKYESLLIEEKCNTFHLLKVYISDLHIDWNVTVNKLFYIWNAMEQWLELLHLSTRLLQYPFPPLALTRGFWQFRRILSCPLLTLGLISCLPVQICRLSPLPWWNLWMTGCVLGSSAPVELVVFLSL